MASDFNSSPSLPPEARFIIWRIFGNGESPLSSKTTYDLIEPTIRKHVPSLKQNLAIDEVRRWFEIYGDQKWLRQDLLESVANLVLAEIGASLSNPNGVGESETVFWAIGSFDPDTTAPIISFPLVLQRNRFFSRLCVQYVEKSLP